MSRHSAEMPCHFPCNNSERTCPAIVRSTTASPFSIREIWNYLECVGVFGLEVDFSNLLRREGVLRGRAKHDVVSWPDTEEVPEAEVANQSPQAMSVEAISQRAFKPEPRSQSPGPTSHESRSQNPESTSQRSLCQADFGRTEDQVEKKRRPFGGRRQRGRRHGGGRHGAGGGQRCPAAICPDAHRHVFHARGEGWSRCLGCASAKTCCMHMSPSLGYVISWVCYLHQHQRRHRHHHNNTHTSTPHHV